VQLIFELFILGLKIVQEIPIFISLLHEPFQILRLYKLVKLLRDNKTGRFLLRPHHLVIFLSCRSEDQSFPRIIVQMIDMMNYDISSAPSEPVTITAYAC
jgi:hypothetical protein